MRIMVKETSLLLAGLMLCTLGVQTGSALSDAHADTVDSTTTVKDSSTTDSWAGMDFNHPVFNQDVSNQLTEGQVQQVQSILLRIRASIQNDPSDFVDPSYAKTMINNMDQRGKAGMTAKAAAKLLKAGLKKMGKKEYEKIAKSSGLELIGLNWKRINQAAELAAAFDGKIETVLQKVLMEVGLNKTAAGIASRTISFIFL